MKQTVICKDIDGNEYEVAISELSWRPSAYGVIIRDGKVLLLKQKTGYDLPGGGVEFGETVEEGVIREVKEESGIDVRNPHLLGVETSLFMLLGHSDHSFIQSVMLYFACEFVGGELSTDGFDEWEKENAEGSEWVSLEDLDALTIGSSQDYRKYIRSQAA